MLSKRVSRREFLQAAGATALGLFAAPTVLSAQGGESDKYFLAVQSHAHDFFFEGAERCCADMREKGGFNATLMAATYVSESKWRGHQPGNDYQVEAGAYFFPDPKFYKDSGIVPERATSVGMENYDALAEASRGARKAGIQIYAWLSDYDVRNIAHLYPECKVHGPDRRPDPNTSWFCMNNPQAQAFALAFYEDIATNYDVDGFFVDRIRTPGATGYCFCPHCKRKMQEAGLDAERLFNVMAQVYTQKAHLPAYEMLLWGGISLEPVFYFPELPEIVAWQGIRMQAVTEHVARVQEAVRRINPALKIGLDLWETSGGVAVGQNIRNLSYYCDWIKPMCYHQSFARDTVRGPVQAIVEQSGGKVSAQQAYQWFVHFWATRGVQLPAEWEEMRVHGMPPAWLLHETRLAMELVEGRVPIYPGVQGWEPATEEEIWQMLHAALVEAEAPGMTTYCWSEFTWEKIATYKRFFNEVLGAA